MLDTSALLPALVSEHALHTEARPHLPQPTTARLPGLVLAEAYARLRGEPFRVSSKKAAAVLAPWWQQGEILTTPAPLYVRGFEDATTLNLGGQIHDYLIALTCAHHGCSLITADRRQASLARPILEEANLSVTLLRADP